MQQDQTEELEVVPTTGEVLELAAGFAEKSRRCGLAVTATGLPTTACARYQILESFAAISTSTG